MIEPPSLENFRRQLREQGDLLRMLGDGDSPPPPPPVDPGGSGDDDDQMKERVQKLEQSLSAIERDVAVIKSNYASKADVAEAKNSVIMWVVSAILLAQLLPPILKKLGL